MLAYENFRLKRMTIRLVNFVKPLIIDNKTFQFPKSSILHYLKVSDLRPVLSKQIIPYINKSESKILVKSIFNYNPEIELGTNRRNTNTALHIINEYKDDDKTIKFLKPDLLNLNMLDKDLLIVNYSSLNYAHVYTTNPLNEFYKWHNTYYTAILNLSSRNTDSTRHNFINIDLPNVLPSRNDLNKYLDLINRQSLDTLTDYKYLNLMDLWRYLTPTCKTKSAFNSLSLEDIKNINLLLCIDNKMVVINLYYLTSLIKEYEIPNSKQSFKYTVVKNLFYIFLNRIISSPSLDFDLVDNTKQPTQVNIEISGLNNVNSLDNLDNMSDEHIEEYLSTMLTNDVNEKADEDNLEVLTTAVEVDNALKENNGYQVYNSLEDINLEQPDFTSKINSEINLLREQGNLTKAQFERHTENINNVLDKKIMVGKEEMSIKDVLNIDNDNFEITDAEINNTNVVFDKAYNTNVIHAMKKSYINKNYKKDLTRTIFSLFNNGVIIEDYNVETEESILGGTETHTFKLSTLNGRSSTNKFILPKIEEDGNFKLSGNTYTMRPQKADLPIRKIDFNEVALSSYYGKLFVTKATFKNEDIGYAIRKMLIKKYDVDEKLKDLVLIPSDNLECVTPKSYNLISRYMKSFKYDGNFYSFEFKNRKNIIPKLTDDELAKLEKDNLVLFGSSKNGLPMLMDMEDNIFIFKNNNLEPFGKLFDILEIDIDNFNSEYLNIRIYKQQIPIVVLLTYYFGLTNLLRMLNVKYELTDKPNTKITSKQYKIKFKDKTLIIDKDYGKGDLVFFGFRSIRDQLIKVNIGNLDDKNKFSILFFALGLSVLYINEIKILENMYIDPITLTILKKLKMPLNFKSLLIKAVEILVDDNYKNPRDIEEMSIKGYERICGMVYNELMTSLKDHNNRSYFSKSKLTLNPYSLINKINEDSTTVLVDDLNPIANIKQNEDLTMLGSFGRSKDGMSRDTREMHSSEIGIISEASKDSGDVGISAYMVASPSLTDTRGLITKTNVDEKLSWANMLSTSSMLAPFAINEDVKRLNFINIQNSHTVHMDNMRVPYVRTGYEAIIGVKANDKFVVNALDDGEVVNVTKSEITVRYKNQNSVTKYKIYSWTSKEESGSCYTHKMETAFVKGEKFLKDDSLVYDSSFFEPDIFNKNRVIYKSGTFVNVGLTEDLVTYEDSAAISMELNSLLATTVTKVKSSVINKTDNIFNNKVVNESVEPSDTLFTIVDGNLVNDKNIDARALEILQNLKSISPKAKVRGVISKIVIYYNCDIETVSASLRKLINVSDAYLLETTGFTGKVNSSYSIQGIPLLENQIEIKTYINVKDNMGIGDKAILGNQLKFTVGDVFEYDIRTQDGTKVDLLFSNKSLAARIVNSPFLIGTTSTVLDLISKKAVDMYFKK